MDIDRIKISIDEILNRTTTINTKGSFKVFNKFISIISLLATSSAIAEPTYLDCKVGEDKSETIFSSKIDEASGKVTHSQPGGFSFNSDGFYSVDQVKYQKIDIISGLKMTRVYTISRVDLSASIDTEITSIEFPNQIPTEHLSSQGSCEIVEVKKRLF